MEDRAGGFLERENAFSDHLPRPAREHLPLPYRCPVVSCQKGERGEPMGSQQPPKPSKRVTEARAAAQWAKLDAQDINDWFAYIRISPGRVWETQVGAHYPDLCSLYACLFPLAGTPRDHRP
jgi:hypothetical protein